MPTLSLRNLTPQSIFTNLGFFLTVAAIYVGYFLSRPAADDYCFMSSINDNGVLNSYLRYTVYWTSSYSSYFLTHFFLGINNGWIGLAVGLAACNYLGYKLVQPGILWPFSNTRDNHATVRIIVLGMLLWVMFGYQGQNLYWYSLYWFSSMTIHTMPIALGSYLITRINQFSTKKVLILTLILGGFGFAESVAWMIVFYTFALIPYFTTAGKINVKYLYSAVLLTGTNIIGFFLPGRRIRQEAMSDWKVIPDFNLLNLFEEVIRYSFSLASEIFSISGIAVVLIVGAIVSMNTKSRDIKLSREILAGSTFVTLILYITCALGAIYSYSQPWQTSSLSASSYFTLLLLVNLLFSKLQVKESISQSGKIATLLLTAVISISSFAISGKVSMAMADRAGLWDSRWDRATTEPVPVLSTIGISMVMDTEGDPWVTSCYRNARGI
jgi:hypothetical protein